MTNFYFSNIDTVYTEEDLFTYTGYSPNIDGLGILADVGIYPIVPDPVSYNSNLYSPSSSFVITDGEAVETVTLSPVPLSDAQDYAKKYARSSFSHAIEKIVESSGYGSLALVAAASKLLADRGSDVQVTLSAVQTKMTELETYISDIDTAADVSEVQRLIEALSTAEVGVFIVTVAGGAFFINGVLQDSLNLETGKVYRFNQNDSTNSGHPLKIYNDPEKESELMSSGISFRGTPGSIGSYTEYITSVPGTYYYQCSNHDNMGGEITVTGDLVTLDSELEREISTSNWEPGSGGGY